MNRKWLKNNLTFCIFEMPALHLRLCYCKCTWTRVHMCVLRSLPPPLPSQSHRHQPIPRPSTPPTQPAVWEGTKPEQCQWQMGLRLRRYLAEGKWNDDTPTSPRLCGMNGLNTSTELGRCVIFKIGGSPFRMQRIQTIGETTFWSMHHPVVLT